jgi:hypothetical protein
MRRHLLQGALVLVCAVGLGAAVTTHAPSVSARAAAAPCASTYQAVEADSGWQYDSTSYGSIKEEAQVVGVFDSSTGAVCRAYGVTRIKVEQYLNQCSYTAWWTFEIGWHGSYGTAYVNSCWTTQAYYSASLGPISGDCYVATISSSERYDTGAVASWCP